MVSIKSILTTAALASIARAETISVTAKDDSFDPDSIKAKEGDIVEFHFDGGNHSVASGLYDFACTPSNLGEGFFSGFVDADDDDVSCRPCWPALFETSVANEFPLQHDVFRVTINSTDPIAFFSSQDKECNGGMVGIINPDDDHTLDDYRERASKVADRGNSPPETYGGELVDDDDNDNDNNGDDDSNNDDNDDDNNDDSNTDDNDEGAATAFRVPIVGLLSAVAVAFALA